MRKLLTMACLLFMVGGTATAQAHLPYKPKNDSLEAQVRTQERNLAHARYVCNNGANAHKRWACKATLWLKREHRETYKVLNPPQPAVTIGYPWYNIAICESGSNPPNWHINTGNGFYGGLQFLTSTWLAYGGGKYAPRADLASPSQQVAIASGMSLTHWPVCGAPYR